MIHSRHSSVMQKFPHANRPQFRIRIQQHPQRLSLSAVPVRVFAIIEKSVISNHLILAGYVAGIRRMLNLVRFRRSRRFCARRLLFFLCICTCYCPCKRCLRLQIVAIAMILRFTPSHFVPFATGGAPFGAQLLGRNIVPVEDPLRFLPLSKANRVAQPTVAVHGLKLTQYARAVDGP